MYGAPDLRKLGQRLKTEEMLCIKKEKEKKKNANKKHFWEFIYYSNRFTRFSFYAVGALEVTNYQVSRNVFASDLF
jgi:hypothetical protein